MSENEKIVSSADYKVVDASPELAKADLSVPASGCNMTDLISENTRCCGGRCKRKN